MCKPFWFSQGPLKIQEKKNTYIGPTNMVYTKSIAAFQRWRPKPNIFNNSAEKAFYWLRLSTMPTVHDASCQTKTDT